MRLTGGVVARELAARNASFDVSIDGYRVGDWLLRRGGGIAGHSGAWFFWNTKTGEKTRLAETLTGLRKLLDDSPAIPCRTCRGRGLIETPRALSAGSSSWIDLNYPATSGCALRIARTCSGCGGKGHGPRERRLFTPRRFRRGKRLDSGQ